MSRPLRFPANFRLKKGWEFDLVFRTSRRVKGELVRLLFVETSEGLPRLGVAVGKRQGPSVVRNRGRRVLREAFRHCRPWVRNGVWIVAMLRTSGLEAKAGEIYEEMARLLDREGLLTEGIPVFFPQGEEGRD